MTGCSGETHATQLLRAASRGEVDAAAELLPLVYSELRKLAKAQMAKSPPGHTLEPTALVHEAYLRLVGADGPEWHGRSHFFFAAARAMRDILVEHARQKASRKRGGSRTRVDPGNLTLAVHAQADDLLALDEALQSLEQAHERRYRVVMLRFYIGLTLEQIAALLGVTTRTVTNDWRLARARLAGMLTGEAGNSEGGDA